MVDAPAKSDTLDLLAARERLGEIVERLGRGGDRIVTQSDGKELAAIVSANDLYLLRQLDARRERAFQGMLKISEAFADVPLPELERQVELALAEVRAEMRAKHENVASQRREPRSMRTSLPRACSD